MKNFFKIWVRLLLKFYPVLLIGALGISFFAFPRMIYLFKHISTDPIDLLPRNFPSVQTLLKIRDKVEPKEYFAVMLESDHPENTRRLLQDLKPLLEKSPHVGEVYIDKIGYDFFDQHKLYYLELKDLKEIHDRISRRIQQEKLSGFYVDLENEEGKDLTFSDLEKKYQDRYGTEVDSPYYVSEDGKIYALYIESLGSHLDLAKETEFQESIQEILKKVDIKAYDPGMKIYLNGSSRVAEYRALIRDLKIAGIISGLLIFLPLLLRFRKPQYILLIFLPLLLGVPSGLALASLWISKLNVTTSFLFAILGGLGIETGIHLFSRYHEKRLTGNSIGDALLDLYDYSGPAIFTAVASLAVTFLLMGISDFKGFSEFGIISGIGLWVIFLYYFIFFPALLVFSEKTRWLKLSVGQMEREFSFNINPHLAKYLLLLFGLFTVFSLAVTPYLGFEYNAKKIRLEDTTHQLASEKQKKAMGSRVNAPAAILIQSPEEAEIIEEVVNHRRDSNPHTTLDYTSTVYSLLPKDQDEKGKVIKSIQHLLEDHTLKLVKGEKKETLDKFKKSLRQSAPVQEKEIPEKIKKLYLGRPEIPGNLFLIHAKPTLEMDDGRNAIAFANEVEEIHTPQKTYYASSDAVIFAEVLKTMFRDSRKVLIISVLSVSLFVFLNFRSFKKTFLIMFSILAGVFWVMGVMYLAGIKMNMYNMVMIPAVMGMSIDNSIHIYHRYEELGKGSLAKVLGTAGVSSLLASLTNAAGFLGLLFCAHGGLRSMGVMASIGLATCLVTTLVYLPLILQYLEKRPSTK